MFAAGIGVRLVPLLPRFVTPIVMAVLIIVLGNRTYRACPNCKNLQLALWSGQISEQNRTIWQKAKEADEKAFKTNKLILLAIVLCILAASLVSMYLEMRPSM